MQTVNIFLSPFAYYVSLDVNDFEEYEKQSSYKKWVDNRKGALKYDFIEFESLEDELNGLPAISSKIGLIGCSGISNNPLTHSRSVSDFTLCPESHILESENVISLLFSEKYTHEISRYSKYWTGYQDKWIRKIWFRVDESYHNLRENIEYSDGSASSKDYHLISKLSILSKPNFYMLLKS